MITIFCLLMPHSILIKLAIRTSLTDEHVEKIVDTPIRKRETIDKYAYVASLDEVKENDYNLNIPRYVDTFEEEEPVDIGMQWLKT